MGGWPCGHASPNLEAELQKLLEPLRGKSRPWLVWIKSVTQPGCDRPLPEGVALESMAFFRQVKPKWHSKRWRSGVYIRVLAGGFPDWCRRWFGDCSGLNTGLGKFFA